MKERFVAGKNISISDFKAELVDNSYYIKKLRPKLPDFIFKSRPQRLIWLVIHLMVIFLCNKLIISDKYSFGFEILLAVFAGTSFGVLGYLGHEIVHGSVIRKKSWIMSIGTLCFVSYGITAKTWISWHNRFHHQNTQSSLKDPDCFGRVDYVKYSPKLQRLAKFLPGSGSILSYTFLFWFLSFHSINLLWSNTSIFTCEKARVTSKLYLIFLYTTWIVFSLILHPFGVILCFLVPVLISNFMFMVYTVTTHYISPLTEDVNDSLVNTISVKTNKFFDWWHLNFSYHTEHHLFPNVNPYYAPIISRYLIEMFPEKYNRIPHYKAIYMVYTKPKFFFNEVILVDPISKVKKPTLIYEDYLF